MITEMHSLGPRQLTELLEMGEFSQQSKLVPTHLLNTLIQTFPRGQYCVKEQNRLAGAGLSIVIHTADLKTINTYPPTYDKLEHRSSGDTLFEIATFFIGKQERRFIQRHREFLKSLCQQMNLRSLILIAPITNYRRHADVISLREYITRVNAKEIYDLQLSHLLKGFQVRRVLKGVARSKEIFALMEWNNIDFDPGKNNVTS